MTGVFEQAIQVMENQGIYYSEPQAFQEYTKSIEVTINTHKTPQFLSVQKLEDLQPELLNRGYMVFRLGIYKRYAYFSLAKLQDPNDWSEYFLIDSEIFSELEPEIFLPNVSIRQLFAFNLLSELTENSLINLAISSGLMATALGIETSESLA